MHSFIHMRQGKKPSTSVHKCLQMSKDELLRLLRLDCYCFCKCSRLSQNYVKSSPTELAQTAMPWASHFSECFRAVSWVRGAGQCSSLFSTNVPVQNRIKKENPSWAMSTPTGRVLIRVYSLFLRA